MPNEDLSKLHFQKKISTYCDVRIAPVAPDWVVENRRIVICAVDEANPSRPRIIVTRIRFRPPGAAPGCQETLKIGKAAGVPAVLDVMKQMPPTAVDVLPTNTG
tara:strand:- start:494 stop:805 length:312 start_codon:yes stop_codon:yes gene_type:complete